MKDLVDLTLILPAYNEARMIQKKFQMLSGLDLRILSTQMTKTSV